MAGSQRPATLNGKLGAPPPWGTQLILEFFIEAVESVFHRIKHNIGRHAKIPPSRDLRSGTADRGLRRGPDRPFSGGQKHTFLAHSATASCGAPRLTAFVQRSVLRLERPDPRRRPVSPPARAACP